jgi:hypothetical protein
MSVRIALAVTFIIGCLYAAFGVFESVSKFGVGMVVSSAAVLVWGLLDYTDSSRDERIAQERDQVWARRDQQ